MAVERKWLEVPAQVLISNGDQYGRIQIPSTVGIKVKQKVQISSNTQAPQILEVKRVKSNVDLELGPIGPEMDKRSNLTLFLTAHNAVLFAPEQDRNKIIPDIFLRAVYEEEPTVALRSFLVDFLGRGYTVQNPFPVRLSDGSVNIGTVNAELEVQLSHKDNDPNAGDVHDSVRIGGGVHEAEVDSDKNLHVESHGNAEDGTDKTLLLSERGGIIVGKVSTLNSTTTPLLANAVFTSTFEEVKDYAYLTFFIHSNVASAVKGLEFHWTNDPTFSVWRTESTNLNANSARSFTLVARARYFRFKYTNGATNQTSFIVGTTLHPTGTGLLTKPLDGAVTTENFAQLVQAPVMARLKDNTFDNIQGLKLNNTSLLGVVEHDAIFGDLGHTFGITTDYVSTGGGENAFLLIRNPVGSGKILRFDRLIFGIPSGGGTIYRCYMTPTVTATGTEIFPVGHRQTGQFSPVVRYFTVPTTTSFGTKFFSTRVDTNSVPFDYEFNYSRLLEPGFDMLITVQPSAGGATSSVSLEYSEM